MDTGAIQPLLDEGERLLERGDLAAAERTFRRAVLTAPDSAVAHSKLGVALAQQDRADEAVAEFTTAVGLQPTYAPAYSNLGNVYREKGMLAEALAAYERALAIDPEYWIAHRNLGILYKQMGRLGDAVEHFKKATRLSARAPTDTPKRRGCLPAPAVFLGGMVLAAAWAYRLL
ncbi:MAG TPA: tetratricopeptide repeat protein [bacterium]|nr:tetratricopeptide repeat protein [bacterium]